LHWCWPLNGKIIHKFSNFENGHKGIDIFSFRTSFILAASSGQAVYCGSDFKGYGNLIIIQHENDYLTAYAHVEKFLIKLNKKIKLGQKIAIIKNNNKNLNKIIHFEIRYKGKAVNPLHYLPKRSTLK